MYAQNRLMGLLSTHEVTIEISFPQFHSTILSPSLLFHVRPLLNLEWFSMWLRRLDAADRELILQEIRALDSVYLEEEGRNYGML